MYVVFLLSTTFYQSWCFFAIFCFLKKLSGNKSFYNKICRHINLLESTNFSNDSWREILGTEFPKDTSSARNLIESIYNNALSIFNVSHKKEPCWDYTYPLNTLDVKVKCLDEYNNVIDYNPDGNNYLQKNISVNFEVIGANVFSNSSKVYWQVVNTRRRSTKCKLS